MRVAFDGRGFTSPAGGVRRYVSELFGAMRRVAPEVEITALGADAQTDRPAGINAVSVAAWLPTTPGWNLGVLPLAARRLRFDVFHAPAYGAPLWGVHPLVLTIHDVSYARHPEWYPHHSDPLRQAFYRASARRAGRILTDSSFSRDEIVAAYGVEPAKIDVVPLGVSRVFSPSDTPPAGPIVLHVGDLHARRNLPMLLEVVLRIRQHDPECAGARLVLVGADRGVLASLEQRVRDIPGVLEHHAHVSEAALVDLYDRAAAFAYPSRYEGFGLPILEAMASGVPVVAARAASVPEVAGAAAILLDVNDEKSWLEALHAMLTNRALALEYRAKGLARAASFSWDRTALDTLECYRRVIGRTAAGPA